VSGPEAVVQLVLGAGAEVEVVHTFVVHTSSPEELHTQVLQSTVETKPGVQLLELGVVVVVGAGVVVVVVVVIVVVAAVVVVQTLFVHTGSPSPPHTQVLQSSV